MGTTTRPAARVFFALWPSESVAAVIAARALELEIGGRHVSRKRLHLTLAFCGDRDGAAIEQLIAFGDGLRNAAFDLVLDRMGHFRRVGVTWFGPTATPAALARLANALAPCSVAYSEGQRFCPHVSVSRKSAPLPPVPMAPIAWRVESFALIASGNQGVPGVYHELARWPLVKAPVPDPRV